MAVFCRQLAAYCGDRHPADDPRPVAEFAHGRRGRAPIRRETDLGLRPQAPARRHQARRRTKGTSALRRSRGRQGAQRELDVRMPSGTPPAKKTPATPAIPHPAAAPLAADLFYSACLLGDPMSATTPRRAMTGSTRRIARTSRRTAGGRPSKGNVKTWTRASGDVGFSVRFFDQYGERQHERCGLESEGWSQRRAEIFLEQRLDEVARGTYVPPVEADDEDDADPLFGNFAPIQRVYDEAARVRTARSMPPLPTRLTAHVFRRSYITHMLEAGAPPSYVQEQVGHEDARTTLEIYSRVLRNRDRRASCPGVRRAHAGRCAVRSLGMKRRRSGTRQRRRMASWVRSSSSLAEKGGCLQVLLHGDSLVSGIGARVPELVIQARRPSLTWV
jgi:integrase-like protein